MVPAKVSRKEFLSSRPGAGTRQRLARGKPSGTWPRVVDSEKALHIDPYGDELQSLPAAG